MSHFKYKYTILVPTHQRGALLRETLRGLLLQEHDNYQIVVSNNYSQDETRTVLSEYARESRVTIIHTDRKLSMPVHWEFAMGHVEGEYIIILGDDDGVRPDFLSTLDIVIENTGANLIKFKTGLYYHNDWIDDNRNTFEFDDRCSNRYFEVDKHSVISDFCEFTNYAIFPNLLQTCFSLELFRKAKKKCGTVFVGAPDWSCPFVLLMDDSAKLVYVDSTLGYGGRSQMSNVAYYFESAANTTQNDRITDFINELSAEVRFPYHEPKITAAGNFTPAAFSYAKHFYDEELKSFTLNKFELCKCIQQDIAEEAVSKRRRFWTPSEFESFKNFVQELSSSEREAIHGMAGFFSLTGRGRLLLKLVKRRVLKFAPSPLRTWIQSIRKREMDSKYPWNTKVNLNGLDIKNGYELMKSFSAIVKKSDECSETKNLALVRSPELSSRGQLNLPATRNLVRRTFQDTRAHI